MKALTSFAIALSVATTLVSLTSHEARSAQGGVQVGVLSCSSVPGSRVDLIIHSAVRVNCVFKTPLGVERYRGNTGIGIGVDLTWSRQEEFIFAVLMATSDVRTGAHALAGRYVGVKASATIGVGVGAAALLGGGDKNVTLQPIGVEGSSGLGVAAGVAYLVLTPA